MKIGIDAHMLGEHETGNERFIAGIVKAFHDMNEPHTYTVFHQAKYQTELAHLTNHHLQKIPVQGNNIWRNSIELPRLTYRQRLDALLVTYTAPLWSACPVVVAVHDISFVHFPQYFPAHIRQMLAYVVPRSLRKASHITTISEYTKQDLIKHYGISPEKIAVTYLSTSDQFKPMDKGLARQELMQKYEIRDKFILAVGNLQPRKNLRRLIEAFAQLKHEKQIEHKLVIIGKKLWQAHAIFTAVKDANLEAEIIFTGYVPDADLNSFYNAADLFVYPSIFEGFGLPVLEAMRCGTATLTSNITAMPEVIGDAAPMFDPYSVEDIAEKIALFLRDDARRAQIGQQCLQRSAQFSWQKSAGKMLQIFENL